MIKAVIIGFAHMHVNEVALYIHEAEGISLVACADLVPATAELTKTRYTRGWNIENVKANYCSNIYDNYIEMLDNEKPDIAFILTETYKKPEIVENCAKRGINVSIEKPMAVTYKEALKIKKSVEKYGVFAMVNWPLTWRPYLHQMKKALDDGIIGNLVKTKFLIGNTGPVGRGAIHRGVTDAAEDMTDLQKSKMWWYQKKCGGGAFLDFCCYGCMFSTWINKEDAVSVVGAAGNYATNFADIYDNGAALVKYKNSLSVLEGTWTTPSRAIPAGPTLYGTEGVITCEREEGIPVVKAFDIYGNDINVPEFSYPEYMKNIATQYVHFVKTGEPVHQTLSFDFNMNVMKLLDRAHSSAEKGKEIKI